MTAGLPVAPGFAVTAAACRTDLQTGGLQDFTRGVLDGPGTSREQSAFNDADRAISERFTAVPGRAEVAEAVRAVYAKLCDDTGVEHRRGCAVQCHAEDSVGASFAGEFETWVDIVSSACHAHDASHHH